jgi:hypothetical protein
VDPRINPAMFGAGAMDPEILGFGGPDPSLLMGMPPPRDPMLGGMPPMDPMMMGDMGALMGMGDPMLGSPMPMPPMLPPPPPGPLDLLEPVPPPVEEFVPPGPQSLPVWYSDPPKPKLADILEEAERERADHQDRIQIAMQTIRRLNLELTGIFKKDRELVEIGEVERGVLTDLRDEHEAYCSHISAMEWNVSVPLKDSIDREETTAKEDAIHYLFECFQRQHADAGNASLKWALPDIAGKYGMLAACLVVDPMNEECGLRFQMVDPATVFPVFEGGMGLARVYRIYSATAAEVMGSFFDAKGTVQKKVKKIATFGDRYVPNHVGEVVEYWDRKHVMVAFEGKEIFSHAHDYGKVPFRIKYCGFGQQGFTRTTDLSSQESIRARPVGAEGSSLRREDLMRIAQPFLLRRFKAHDIEEAVHGLMLTAMRRQINPMWVQQLGMQSHNDGAVQVKQVEGGNLVLRDDDIATPQPPVLTPDVVNAVTALNQQNKQTGMASGVIMGMMPGGQTTGSGIDILNQAGLEKWRPLVMVVEEFLTELAEWALELLRDWGGILGTEGSYGSISIPSRRPNPRTGMAAAHDLTPKILRTHGVRCRVELRRFNPHNMSTLMNGLAIAMNMGVLDKRTIIDMMGFTNNPDAILDRINEEMLESVPEVLQEKTLRSKFREAEIAKERGDFKSAEEAMNAVYFIASEMQRKAMIGQAAPIDPATGLPMPTPGVPIPPNVPVQGDPSLSGMPGAQGGRPPGGGAPTPIGPGGPAG